jgi:hypothetical protein
VIREPVIAQRGRFNLNLATNEQLTALADAGCPYQDPGELVTRGILPKNKYHKIADRLTVNIWRAELCLSLK